MCVSAVRPCARHGLADIGSRFMDRSAPERWERSKRAGES